MKVFLEKSSWALAQAALEAERERLEKLLEKEEALAKTLGPKGPRKPAEASSDVDALDAFMHHVEEQMEKDKVIPMLMLPVEELLGKNKVSPISMHHVEGADGEGQH